VKRPLRTGLVLTLVCLVLGGCGTLSVQEEKQLGYQVQREVRAQFQLLRDPVVVNYVREMGQTLVQASRPSPFEFRFYVVEDEQINAFAIPGGAVYVHTGLIAAASDSAELAGVLAHEIGHVTARHVAHLYRRQRNTGVVAQVVSIVIAIISGNRYIAQGGQLATGVAAQAYLNTYTQDAERDADALAVESMIRADYAPDALVTMLQTLQQEAGAGMAMPQFLKSHPATAERIQNVSVLIRAQGSPQGLRRDDRKLAIIQKRIELIVGTDIDSKPQPE
jgi:predicted Zn-dependent protease